MIVFRALQGFIGGGMIPTVFASAYIDLPRPPGDDLAGDRPGRDAGADHRPDGRRLPDRPVLLALAVPGQRRARHRGHRRRLADDRLRRAGSRAVQALRLGRPRLHGGDAGLARIRAGGRAERRLVAGRPDPHPGHRRGSRRHGVLLAGPEGAESRSSTSVPSPTATSRSAAPSAWSWASDFMA